MCRSAAVLLLLAMIWARPAQACKCAEPPSAREALEGAAAVFDGHVEKITPSGSELVIEFSVARAWKNAGQERISVRTAQESAACGYPFSAGESYLVYAGEAQAEGQLPALRVSHCSRTRTMAEGEADVAEIGMGVVPFTPSGHPLAKQTEGPLPQQNRPAAGGCASCSVGQRGAPAPPRLAWIAGALALLLAIIRRPSLVPRRPTAPRAPRRGSHPVSGARETAGRRGPARSSGG